MARSSLALVATLAVAMAMGASAATEMSSSAIVFYNSDFRPLYWPEPLCEKLIARAATHGGKRVQIVPTLYWYDARNLAMPENTCGPDTWAKTDQHVDYYCNKDVWDSPCVPFTQAVIDELTAGFARCFKFAFEHFDELLLAPHLDDGLKRGHWRNLLHFDPLKKDAHGFTYFDIMIKPILDAVNTPGVAPAGKKLWFGMQGEMGGTVFSYPKSWITIAGKIRDQYKGGANLLLGVMLNHAYLYGYINRGPAAFGPAPPSAFSKYDGGFGKVLPLKQWPHADELVPKIPTLKKLFYNTVDFMGISNYARAPVDVKPIDIESAMVKYADELKTMGLSLTTIQQKNKFIMNEFALGGGVSECGDSVATTAKDTGLYPWLGITTPYAGVDTDPWKKTPVVKAYLIKYYEAALKLLAKGGIKYKVDGCYLWNIVSWDVQGIHTASATWNGDPVKDGFAVPEVIDMIKKHNQKYAK